MVKAMPFIGMHVETFDANYTWPTVDRPNISPSATNKKLPK